MTKDTKDEIYRDILEVKRKLASYIPDSYKESKDVLEIIALIDEAERMLSVRIDSTFDDRECDMRVDDSDGEPISPFDE